MVPGYKGDVVLDGINTALVPLHILRLVCLCNSYGPCHAYLLRLKQHCLENQLDNASNYENCKKSDCGEYVVNHELQK